MKNRPIILLDVDGPLACFTEAYLKVLEEETGAKYGVEEVDQWAIHKCNFFLEAAHRAGITADELKSRVYSHIVRPGFCYSLKVQDGAREALEELRRFGDVYAVTSPWDSSETWMHERLHWCHRQLDFPRGRVIQAGEKDIVFGDVFVDDKLSHVVAWQKRWTKSRAFLFDMHHNKRDARRAGISGSSWKDVIAHLERES